MENSNGCALLMNSDLRQAPLVQAEHQYTQTLCLHDHGNGNSGILNFKIQMK